MTPSSETEIFLGWFQWESCSPGYSGHLLHWQKSRSLYKKLTFGPKYPNFGVKKHIFTPSGQLEPHWSMFSTQKRCLIGILIWGYQNFYSLPPKKLDFGPKKRPNLAQNWHFGPNIGIFGPFDLMPDQSTNADRLSRWFSVMLVPKTFTYSHKN